METATYGGSLAAPSTDLENAYIRQQLTEYYAVVNPSEHVYLWIGAHEYLNYTWHWSNEELFTFEDWSEAEHYHDYYAMYYGNILASQFFHWITRDGRSRYPSICEHKL